MRNFIIRRFLVLIPLYFGITIITFLIIHLAPGKPSDLEAQIKPGMAMARARLEKIYGLDKPLHVQYWLWFKKMIVFDFGNSFKDHQPVLEKIRETLPNTILLNLASLLLIYLIAVPIGILSAVKQYSPFDKISTIFVFIGMAIPSFWLALLLILVFSVKLAWLPISGMHSLYFQFQNLSFWAKTMDIFRHALLPVIVLSLSGLAWLSRYTRSSVLEIIRQDYITTARAKGLSERKVIFKHALRNALLPIVTILGLSLPGLISGSVIVETIFAWPGMGRLAYQAVLARDYPVIMGASVFSVFLLLFGNLVADLLYAVVDPRIKYE
ncbi:MAG: ABC transporter permease [Calditrichaeota bacterium]|nr:ABC transporter permease [Calditrichota bacterium]